MAGLGASLLTFILFLVGKVNVKMTMTMGGMSSSGKEKIKIMDIVTNENDAFDEVLGTARIFTLIAFILVVVALVYFVASVVLDVLKVKLPVAKADLIGAVVLVVAVVCFGLVQFFGDKEGSKQTMLMEMSIQTLASAIFYVSLVAGAGAVAANVVLKD